ncbi:MAG: hypothetical protein NVS3B3_11500 [Aquirhabdus sp.]
MSRFYADIPLSIDTVVELTEMVHHWTRVLRAKVGDQATLFNGLAVNTTLSS